MKRLVLFLGHIFDCLRLVRVLPVACLLLGTFHAIAGAQATPGLNDITILSTDVSHFGYGAEKQIHIFENTRNQIQYPNNPERWQFVVEPLLTPKLNSDGSIYYKEFSLDPVVKKYPGGGHLSWARTRITIPIWLMSPNSKQMAQSSLRHIFPKIACSFTEDNVDLLPVTKIQFDPSDMATLFPQARLVDSQLKFYSSPAFIELKIDIAESDTKGTPIKDAFIKALAQISFHATVSFNVKSSTVNLVSISADKLIDTDLYRTLKGLGDEAYVKRDDLQRLAIRARSQLSTLVIIEDPKAFDQNLFTQLLQSSQEKSVSEGDFDSTKWAHTYNGDDLKPNKITKTINDTFDYTKNTDQWDIKGNVSAKANANLLGLLSAGGEGQASYSTAGLKEALAQHAIHAEFNGEKWIAKSIDLVQVNISSFAVSNRVISETRRLGPTSEKADLPTPLRLNPDGLPTDLPADPLPACQSQPGTSSTSSASPRSNNIERLTARVVATSYVRDTLPLAVVATASSETEEVGCCCLKNDLNWDCTGYKDGTMVTKSQCKKDAESAGAAFKWHAGKCTDKD